MERQAPVRSITERKTSAVDLVLHEIRRSILNGALAPGEPFVVQKLTEQLGVSHVPVREALRQLEAQGLITLSHSRSAVVAPLDVADLRSVYRLRRWIEPELGALSAPTRSEAELARLKDLLDLAFADPSAEERWDLHRQFHQLLLAPAATERDLRMLRGLWDASERFTRLTFDPVAVSQDELPDQGERHQELIEAASSRDSERMRTAIRVHLEENEAATAQRLDRMAAARGVTTGNGGSA